ncbi:MAG: helix-turn-helix transcriptional regulator [Crocinitomicaceae bacterium]|nr:helix-turn-helix transcriptional regulator [Crocinitomicaceae bacterium]
MDFPFSFGEKSSLLLIFFFHGIVFSALALRKGIVYKDASSKWLSLLLFLYAMYVAPYMLGYAGWYFQKTTRDILFFIPFMQILLIGPVVFFYTKSLLNLNFKLTRKEYIHFLPAFCYIIYSLVIFITDKLILDEYYFYADGRDKDLANWYQGAGLISMAFYLILSLRYYILYKKLVFDKVSYAETILFQWIRNFMIAFLGILVLRVLFFILNPEWGEFGSQFWHYISFSFIFYYIAVSGYSSIIKRTTLTREQFDPISIFEDTESIDPKIEQESSKEDDSIWRPQLSELMEQQQLFKNPRLTLYDVAEELNTTPKNVSSVVNSSFNMNFNDFINHYRIEAVKQKLNDGEHTTSTLLGIALDCGFNSKATFNRAFKKSTSMTPREYLSKLANE